MVFVSLIIPFNKSERYLKDCFDSIFEQNLENIEIILIVNGYSPDLSEFLKGYSNLNIIVKFFDDEIGVAKARNEGLKIASGEYIYFIDGDDYLYKNSLSKLVNVAKRSNADFINGERMNSVFIRDRIEEKKAIVDEKFLRDCDCDNNLHFSMKLLVGTKTGYFDFLSVLHSLIKREKLKGIYFDEIKRYNVDYSFILNLISNCDSFIGVEDAIYVKRIRDDSVNLTSLNQEPKKYSLMYHYQNYLEINKFISQHDGEFKFRYVVSEINDKIQRYYLKKFAIRLLNEKYGVVEDIYFEIMSDMSQNFNIDKLKPLLKKEIIALQQKDKEKLLKLINTRARINKIKLISKNRWMFKSTIYEKYFNKKELIENKIIFESFYGRYYSDSPKYIYEYLYNYYNDKFEFVWVINDDSVKIPGNPIKVKRFSLEYYKHFAQSKYYVFNTRQPGRLKKREEQVFISTWHGTPLKKLGFDQGNIYLDNPNSKRNYRRDALKWDYLISPNDYTTGILRSSFTYEGEIIESGYPRNDILYNEDDEKILQIKRDLNFPIDKKIILYAPTWRDDEQFDTGKVSFELKLKLNKLKEKFSDEYILILRMHYFISDNIDLSDVEGFAFDLSKYEDIAELYLISDLLITDYSSVFFDFANLKRPILFYTYDLEKYENVLRGFYIDINTEVPGPLLKTTDEVIDAIENIDKIKEEFSQKYDEFYNRFCYIEDGNASKRIVEKIWDVL